MRFWRLYLMAWVRGLFYRWPHQAPTPRGYYGVSCGLKTFAEVRAMWGQGWEPWCFQRIYGYRGLGTARLFRVPMTDEEKEYERLNVESYLQMAKDYAALQAARADRDG